MAAKPSYLGLLNAIAVGEARGEQLLSAWAARTEDEALASTLRRVAIREREHAAAFAKRICELGFEVRETQDASFAARLACADGDATDLERFRELLGYGADHSTPDDLGGLFENPDIDPQTGALLGRFIAEERDSDRQLRAEYERIRDVSVAVQAPGGEALDARLDALEAQMAQLRDFLRCERGT